MINGIKDRVNLLIKSLGINKSDFAKETSISSAMISKITTQEVNFSIDIYQKIVNKYTRLNQGWLLNGTGEMWINNPIETNQNADLIQQTEIKETVSPVSNEIDNLVRIHKEYLNTMDCIVITAYSIYRSKSDYLKETDFETLKFLNEYSLSKIFDVLQGKLTSEKYENELRIYLTVAKDLLYTYIKDLRAVLSGFEPGTQFAGSINELYEEFKESMR